MLKYDVSYSAETMPNGMVVVRAGTDGIAVGEEAIKALHDVCYSALLAIAARREPFVAFDPMRGGHDDSR